MSLLNDALRAAEQRQGRPGAPAAYTGQSAAVPAHRQRGLWLAVVALVLVLLITGWWLFAKPTPAVEEINRPVVTQQPPEPEPQIETARPEPEPEPEPVPVPMVAVAPAPAAEPAAAPAAAKVPAGQPVVAETPPVAETTPSGGLAKKLPEAPSDIPVANTADVKQMRETPAVIDRRTSRELDRLLRAGRWAEARQTLAALTDEQAAPLSRHVLAKRLLIEGETEQALALLPDAIAQTSAPLRLLRARALLANDDLASAVASLRTRVPEIADNTEYYVTLATLLHQSGSHEEAASRWAELIAWDDSRAPWWVGLAIALESGGQRDSARRAYEQAAALPGLPPSLAEYVRQRLQSLRAG